MLRLHNAVSSSSYGHGYRTPLAGHHIINRSGTVLVADEPIDRFLRELQNPIGALSSVRTAMGIGRSVTLKKEELSRMKKPCLTYKVWPEYGGQSFGAAVVVKFSPWDREEKEGSWSDVGQEYKIQHIVKRDSDIPVAEVLHLSTDEEKKVVGAKFMVMAFVKGQNYKTVSDIPRQKKRLVMLQAVKALAHLHSYHWVWRYGSGLEIKMDQTSSKGYWEKMINIWFANFRDAAEDDASRTHRSVKLYREMKAGRKPDRTDTCLVHGDYDISNLIFNDNCEVVAILDWKVDENADPLADVAYFMMVFLQPGDYGYRYKQLPKLLLGPPGEFIPSEDTVLGFYRQASIHSFTDEDYGFAKAVSCLRLISIFKAAADDDFVGHESATCPVIKSEPQQVVKILTDAGWNFFETWKGHFPAF